MTRFIVLLAIALFVVYWAHDKMGRLRSKLTALLDPISGSPGRKNDLARAGGELVACAECGVHVSRSRALLGAPQRRTPGDRAVLYCSEACRQPAALRR